VQLNSLVLSTRSPFLHFNQTRPPPFLQPLFIVRTNPHTLDRSPLVFLLRPFSILIRQTRETSFTSTPIPPNSSTTNPSLLLILLHRRRGLTSRCHCSNHTTLPTSSSSRSLPPFSRNSRSRTFKRTRTDSDGFNVCCWRGRIGRRRSWEVVSWFE